MTRELPPPELLRKLLRYEPDTGKLFWLERGACFFSDSRLSAQGWANNWNAKYAGQEALAAINGDGYAGGRVLKVSYGAHRIAWALHFGEWPSGEIDHLNGNKSDNRICNLRDVTKTVNCRNRPLRADNKSGVNGVYLNRKSGKWRAQIRIDGKIKHLGMFESKESAVRERLKWNAMHEFTDTHGLPRRN